MNAAIADSFLITSMQLNVSNILYSRITTAKIRSKMLRTTAIYTTGHFIITVLFRILALKSLKIITIKESCEMDSELIMGIVMVSLVYLRFLVYYYNRSTAR